MSMYLKNKYTYGIILPVAGLVIGSVASIGFRTNPYWIVGLIAWTILSCIISMYLISGKFKKELQFVDDNSGKIVCVIICACALLFITINLIQTNNFALSQNSEDTAYYNQILHNTLKGKFLVGNVQQERLYNPPVRNDIALHVSPILLLILPLYALFQKYWILLILRDLVLAGAAWPLFLLARERISGTAGVAAVILYLGNPAVLTQSIEGFYLSQFAPLPIFYAFRAFIREEPNKFLCWTIVSIFIREDVSITMAGFGLCAILSRRNLRWVAMGFGIPIAWWCLTTLLIQPAFGRWGNSPLDISLTGGTKNPIGSYLILLGNPGWVLKVLKDGGLSYLYKLFSNVGFLIVFVGEGLISVPALVANLFLARTFPLGIDPNSRFALLPYCVLIGASIVAVQRIARRNSLDIKIIGILFLLILPSVSLLNGAKDTLRERLANYTVKNEPALIRDALSRIPGTASVAAPNYALPALSNRTTLYYLQYMHKYTDAKPDYIFLDLNLERVTKNPELLGQYTQFIEAIKGNVEYICLWHRSDYYLYCRKALI